MFVKEKSGRKESRFRLEKEGKEGILMLESWRLSLIAFARLLTCSLTSSKRLSSPNVDTRDNALLICSESSEADRRRNEVRVLRGGGREEDCSIDGLLTLESDTGILGVAALLTWTADCSPTLPA